MDIHSTFETLAEAWVAASTPTAVNPEPKALTDTSAGDQPSMLPKEQHSDKPADDHTDDTHTKDNDSASHHHHQHANDDPMTQQVAPSTMYSPTPLTMHSPTPLTMHEPRVSSVSSVSPAPSSTSLAVKGFTGPKTPSPRKAECSQPAIASMPIRCLVEQVQGAVNFDLSGGTCDVTAVEEDTFAILPVNTPLSGLVRAALAKLGYSTTDSVNAKGAIQLKNWKPLTFDVITDDKSATIDDILRELKEYTLRIRLSRVSEQTAPWGENGVRCAVLSLLKRHSQSALAKLSPLSQSTISNIANGRYKSRVSSEKCREFGQWYASYLKDSDYMTTPATVPPDSRLTFHPDHEVPLLRSWYRSHPNPTADDLHAFAYELNKGHVRQDRVKVTADKVKVWWKNERQRERRLQACSPAGPGSDSPHPHPAEGEVSDCGVRTRKRSRSARQGSRSAGGETNRGQEGESVVTVDDEGGGDSALHHTVTPGHSRSQWGRHTDIGHPGLTSIGEEPSPPSRPPASHHLHLPHPPRGPSPKQVRKVASEVDSVTFPAHGQDHSLLPGQLHLSPWQPSLVTWSGHRHSAEVNLAPQAGGIMPPWPQPLYQVHLHQREGSRSEGEREDTGSGQDGQGQVDKYKYSQTATPYNQSSGSMDFSHIL